MFHRALFCFLPYSYDQLVRSANYEIVYASVLNMSASGGAQTINPVGVVNEGQCELSDLRVVAELGTDLSLELRSPMASLTNPSVSVRIRVAEDCPPGYFLTGLGCEACPENRYLLVFSPDTSECKACPKGAGCEGSNLLVTKAGWWRTSSSSDKLLPCSMKKNCLAGDEAQPRGKCQKGSNGPLCGVCEANYFRAANECIACKESTSNDGFYTVAIATLTAFALVLIGMMGRRANSATNKTRVRASTIYRATRQSRLKIVIVAFQIISSVEASLHLTLPYPFSKLLNLLNVLQLNLGLLPIVYVHMPSYICIRPSRSSRTRLSRAGVSCSSIITQN